MKIKTGPRRRSRHIRHVRHITLLEFRTISLIVTMIVAGIALITRNNEPVVWAFLSAAIGMNIGQAIQSKGGG